VSVGIETLEAAAQSLLPAAKHCSPERFDDLAGRCVELGIDLNCFAILGLPGSTIDGTLETARHVRARGAKLRPTFYARYQELRPDMEEAEIARYNRQLAPAHLSDEDASRLYRLVHAETAAG